MDMYVKTTSSLNVSLHDSNHSSSHHPFLNSCFNSPSGYPIFTGFTVTNILLLLPLSVFILYLGFDQWRRKRSSEAMNPVDVFTYHMVAMEMIGISCSVVCCCGAFTDWGEMMYLGCNTFAIISCLKMSFHVLTCVERYVAVVHPMTYLTVSKTGGVMFRNISIGCVWILCSGLVALRLLLKENFTMILFFCNLVFSLIVTSFCSISVLRVLQRPGPGDEAGKSQKVDKSKQKAFVTITAIMAVLLLRFGGNLVCMALADSSVLNKSAECMVRMSGIWFCLPSSYVLPLLYLHRAEKLLCLNYKSDSA